MQKREERARKRRLQAAKKAEENKNQTIERLTKTSKAKIKSLKDRRSKQSQCPMVRYRDSAQGIAISFPSGVSTPGPAPLRPPPVALVSCGVSGCSNRKKYSCSKTGVPLCSLECYKRNLLMVQSAAWSSESDQSCSNMWAHKSPKTLHLNDLSRNNQCGVTSHQKAQFVCCCVIVFLCCLKG